MSMELLLKNNGVDRDATVSLDVKAGHFTKMNGPPLIGGVFSPFADHCLMIARTAPV